MNEKIKFGMEGAAVTYSSDVGEKHGRGRPGGEQNYSEGSLDNKRERRGGSCYWGTRLYARGGQLKQARKTGFKLARATGVDE